MEEILVNIRTFLSKDPHFKFRLKLSLVDRISFGLMKWVFGASQILGENTFIRTPQHINYEWMMFLQFLQKHIKFSSVPRLYKQSVAGADFYNARSVLEIGHEKTKTFAHAISFKEPTECLSRACGEAIERHVSACKHINTPTIQATVIEMKKKYNLTLSQDFHRYSDQNLYINKHSSSLFSETKPVFWVFGKNLYTGDTVPLLEQQVFWFDSFALMKKEWFAAYANTNGCAAGFVYEDAVVSAIFELIERDAFSVHWLTKTSPRIVDISDSELLFLGEVRRAIQSFGYSCYVMDITTDIAYPSICVTAVRWGTDFDIHVSAASDFDPLICVEKALKEVLHSLNFSMSRTHKNYLQLNFESYVPFANEKIGQFDRVYLWKDQKWQKELASWWFSGEHISFEMLQQNTSHVAPLYLKSSVEKLNHILSFFKEKSGGYDNVYVYTYSSAYIHKLDYCVVRAIIPKLYPLYLHEVLAYTDSERLTDFTQHKNKPKTIYAYPHPFI